MLLFLRAFPCVRAQSFQSCLTLCDLMDCSLSGSSVHRILQARILDWVTCAPPGDLLDAGIELASLASSALADGFFTTCCLLGGFPLGLCFLLHTL